MKVGDLVVYKEQVPWSAKAGVGLIRDENPYFYFIYWSAFPNEPLVATRKNVVRLANESSN